MAYTEKKEDDLLKKCKHEFLIVESSQYFDYFGNLVTIERKKCKKCGKKRKNRFCKRWAI